MNSESTVWLVCYVEHQCLQHADEMRAKKNLRLRAVNEDSLGSNLRCSLSTGLLCLHVSICRPSCQAVRVGPRSEQCFDVPVQLLSDNVMPVNNSAVPFVLNLLCSRCWHNMQHTLEVGKDSTFFPNQGFLLQNKNMDASILC